jgi:uncharacterized protein YeaO (DUF488 family)
VTASKTEPAIRVKRIHDSPEPEDGARLLVDRIWPRGISKERAALDAWMREVAPSTELRKWFGHDASRWREFKRRYASELSDRRELVDEILELARRRRVTLLYSARDREHNQAIALAEYLNQLASGAGGS